jgi:hypothetical protein
MLTHTTLNMRTTYLQSLFMKSAAAARPLPKVMQDLDPALECLKPLKTKSGSKFLYDNPWAPGATTKPAADIFKLVRTMKVVDPPAAAVAADLPFADLDLAGIHSYKQGDAMRATWIGHATGACSQLAALICLCHTSNLDTSHDEHK